MAVENYNTSLPATASSTPMIRRLGTFFSTRIRENHLRRLSSTASSSAALRQPQASDAPSPSPSQSESLVAVHMTDNCVRRMKELQSHEGKEKMLRLSIEAGGCSGFQYNFSLDDKSDSDDRVFEREGVKLVVDKISLDFVKGATVDYVEELIRSAFQVSANPSAVGGCSCKVSFMV
ncbi:OLC1v1034213C1 [Oldenlandia corymbosa var. corymbosa]|uniref:OLC1v1034213C1 n=1 Tax=Oldenlandia corymbosa var. corymbosa TaxID=529605 RepID=A0AAV1CT85_OLDCO|nr:OLC1v1034213C1 [Oldenlandia corymbosa var. corymbosa]